MEREADFFAASLLVFADKLRSLTFGREFSLDILKEISNEFQVRITSVAIRLAEIGTHGIMIVFNESGTVK
jgi:Zn-dependent peptidase ImmA (M78 family)